MSFWVPRRRPELELLDADGVPAHEAEASLADIEWVHRRLGGRSLVRRRLIPLLATLGAPGIGFSILDLGCGSGHVGRDLVEAAAAHGMRLHLLGIDRKVSHARLAARGSTVAGDAFLAESRRVAASAVVVFDLTRHRLALAAIGALGPIAFRSALSVADGKTSARQAYTPEEIAEIAAPVLPGARVSRAARFVWELVWTRP
jgi:SAM-dependent methyltransferase